MNRYMYMYVAVHQRGRESNVHFFVKAELLSLGARPKQETLRHDIISDVIERLVDDVRRHDVATNVDVIESPYVRHVTCGRSYM